MTPEERIKELEGKNQLSDEEMKELIRLKPGAFLKLPDFNALGVQDIERGFKNLGKLMEREAYSYKVGCYVEAISLYLQHTEFWLRSFWVARNKNGEVYGPDDRRMFGGIISDCEKLGFDTALVARLRAFNKLRVDAIHKFILGAIEYEELKGVCDTYATLPGEVGTYVRNQIGVPLK